MNNIFVILLFTLVLVSCKKDIPPQKDKFNFQSGGTKLLIANEGNFGLGNAGLSVYNPDNNQVVENIYADANNNASLGDVCQSVTKVGSSYYLVVNNSQKVVVIDAQDFTKKAEINGFVSPRYLLQVSNNKAYVSNLKLNAGLNYIQIIDLNSNVVSNTIACNGWTEEMQLSYGQVFVCNKRTNYLYVIDSSSDIIIDSLLVGYGSGSIVKDKNEKLWVACSGDQSSAQLPRIVQVDPISKQILRTLYFPDYSHSADNLCFNKEGDELLYMDGSVYKIAINDTILPSTPFISKGNMQFYQLTVNPNNGDVYISDAINYIQRGVIMVYDRNGNFKNSFNAGIIPGEMLFD